MAPDANSKHPWLYVSGFNSNNVAIFDLAKVGSPQIGSITRGVKGPCGMAVDSSGTLYVANDVGSNVTIYPPGAVAPSLTLATSLTQPTSTAVDGAGNVFVTNRNVARTIAEVVVFPPGQTTPSLTITSGTLTDIIDEALDPAGNLYVADRRNGVAEIPGGTSQVVPLGLGGLTSAGGITIDGKSGDLLVAQDNGPSMRIQVYRSANPEILRTLKGSYVTYSLAMGTIDRHEYAFVPDASTGRVYLFRAMSNHPYSVISPLETADICGVAFKPAGVP
jgi:serine/threonine-protein kinase